MNEECIYCREALAVDRDGYCGHPDYAHLFAPERYEVADRGHKTPCWIWLGTISPEGYARATVKRQTVYVHRAALGRDLPRGSRFHVDHLCRQRACVNPAHLELVTNGENIRRAYRVCKRGHEMRGENIYVRPNGQRMCRTCQQMRAHGEHREAA